MKCSLAYLFALVLLASSISNADDSLSLKLEKNYLDILDDWVNRGGPTDEIQETVIGTCSKLVMVTAGAEEKAQLATTEEELHFRVDACAKMTGNRVHPQAQLQKPAIVKMICGEKSVEVFSKLCQRCGLQ